MKTVLRIVLVLSLCLCISAFLGTNAFAEEILVIHNDDMYEADTQYYEITLSANGGYFYNDPGSALTTTSIREGSSFYGGAYQLTNPDPHTAFTGWYYDAACTQLAVSRSSVFRPDRDLTLYAGWSEGWIVTFDANGGQFSSGASTLRYSVPKGSPLSYSPYVRSADPDYEWDYWALEDGTIISEWKYVPEGDVTLYAHYVHCYLLTLDANGGYFYNDPSSALTTALVREGSTFNSWNYQPTNPNPHTAFTGWYYDPECTQLAVSRDGIFTPDNDLTLYAGWSEGWIVTFDANGGQFGSGASTLHYTVPKGSPLSYSPYVESVDPGYKLNYWALKDGARIYEWEFVPEGDVTLYAHYVHCYLLTLDANGGYFYNDLSSALTTALVREGSTFNSWNYQPTNPNPHTAFTGWYYDPECTQLAVSRDGIFTPDNDLTLYAGWSEGWIVTFDANGGQFDSGNSTLHYTVPKGSPLSYSPYVKSADPDYELDYWALKDGTRINMWDFAPEGNVTLYAHYVHCYLLTLDANDGYFYNDPSSVLTTTRVREGSSFYGGEYRPTNPDPHTAFTGWYYDAACTQLAVSRSSVFRPDRDLTLYAGWSEGWIVTFDANGGQFGSGASTLHYTVPKGSSLSYSPYVPSADSDYVNDYWTLEDGTRIDEWDFIPEGDVTLYAHYSRLYRLILDANGGYFYYDPDSALTTTRIREGSSFYGGDYHPTNPDPHMFFTGWYYDAACTSLAATHDGNFTPNSDLTLYAGWSQGYAVIFETNDDTWVPKPQTKIPGETLVLRWDAPRREGFYFLGWAENADAETASYLPGENYTQDADVTLYALWGNPDFVLPDGVTEIEEEAFAGAAARFVKLPDSLVSVGPRAFAGCMELQYIVIPDYLNQIDFSAFEGTENVIVLTFSQFRRLYRLPDYMRMMAP